MTAGAAVAGFDHLVDAASGLEQAIGGTEAVFQENSSTIDAWARNSVDSVGLSERAYRELSAVIGGQLKGQGLDIDSVTESTGQLVQIGADLAATFGGSTEEAVSALGATFRGEYDPAERFGLALSAAAVGAKAVELGLADSATGVTGQARAMATLALINEQTADAQGQFAREADTAAGAQARQQAASENAAASMGDNFLPVYQQGQAVLQGLASGFGALPGPIQTTVVILAGMAALRAPVTNALGGIGDSLGAMRTRFTAAGGGAKGLAAAITPGALGLAVAAGGLSLLASGLAENAQRAEEAKNRMRELSDAFVEGGQRAQADTLLNQLADQAPEAVEALNDAGVSVRELVEAASDPAAFDELILGIQEAGNLSDLQTIHLYQMAQATVDAANAGEELADSQEANADASADATDSLGDQAASLQEVADAADEARDKMDALFGIEQGLDEANVEVQASSDALTRSLRENGRTFNINTQRGRDNMQAAREAASAIRDQTISYRANGASVAQATQNNRFLTGALRNTLAAAGLNRREIDNLISTYGRVPRSVLTALTVTGSTSGLGTLTSALQEVANAYNQVEANRASAVSGLGQQRGGPGLDKGSGPQPRGRSRGGDVHVHVAGIGTPQQIAREIMPVVIREIERLDRRR